MTETRLGVVVLPEHPWSEARAVWQQAEAMGFDHAWTYDPGVATGLKRRR